MRNLRNDARVPLRPAPGRTVARVDLAAYREACSIVREQGELVAAERRALAFAACLYVMSSADRAVVLEDLRGTEAVSALALIEDMLAALDQAAKDYPDGWPKPRAPQPDPAPEPEPAIAP